MQFPLRRPAAVDELLCDEAMAALLGVFMSAVHAALIQTRRLVVVIRHKRVVGVTIITQNTEGSEEISVYKRNLQKCMNT